VLKRLNFYSVFAIEHVTMASLDEQYPNIWPTAHMFR